MFSKKSLAVGLVAALGTSTALAAFDLDLATQTGTKFALETLDSGDATTIGSTSYPNITNAGNALDVEATIGVGVSNGQSLFVRYDLTNAVFGAAPTFTTATASNSAVQGGTAGASFVIFQITASSDIGQTQTTTMAAGKYASTDVSMPIGVTMNVYETLTQATSSGTALVTKTSKSGASLVTYATGLKLTAAGATSANIADVENGFKKFTATAISTSRALIGSSVLAADTTVLSADDGLAVAIGDMINTATSKATISGDFSGTKNKPGIDAATNCATQTALTANTAKNGATALTVAAANAKPNLCFEADAAASEVIPKGDYTVAYTLVAAATTRTNQTTSLSGTIGTIAHNGTTVELPYLTTFEDYNQRLIMVNRSATAADYTVSAFQAEDGTTATAGTMASGSIPAGGTAVVKVTDIVTLTGNTRTAATLNVVAPSAKISVATTQVNKSDGGTDTISLQ